MFVLPSDAERGEIMSTFNDPFAGEDGRVITPTDLANALHIGAKTVRDRMRKMTAKSDQPGSGGHWDIEVGSPAYIKLVTTLQDSHRNKRVERFDIDPAD
jgi:hypothetical protein